VQSLLTRDFLFPEAGQQSLQRIELDRFDKVVIEAGGARAITIFILPPSGQRN
jgi:hypothetical protein